MTLHHLFYPRNVALVGSVAEGKVGFELLRQMLKGGYRDACAVNPKAQGALGVPGYAAIGAIPAPVDLAVISSPAATVAGILEECGQVGVKAAVIISSGFSEMGNKAGEVEIKAIAARHGIRIVGPNCAGIINTSHRLCPTMETLPPPGPVALISQSGALAGVVLGWAARDGLGISKFVSYGNRSDINEVDLLEYLANDEETHVVGLYVETVSDGRAFMAAAAKCAARKPVIVIKAGRGESGQRATLSHTGSLAGSDAVYDAALRQCGAIRVESAEEMFDLCRGFVGIPQGIRGRRVAIVTNSGGPSILAADRAEVVGLDVAEPGPAIRAKLASFLPPHAALKNPIDLTVEGTERGYREALMALLAQDEVKAEVKTNLNLNLSLTLTSTLASTPSSPSTSHRPIWIQSPSRAASAMRPRPRASLSWPASCPRSSPQKRSPISRPTACSISPHRSGRWRRWRGWRGTRKLEAGNSKLETGLPDLRVQKLEPASGFRLPASSFQSSNPTPWPGCARTGSPRHHSGLRPEHTRWSRPVRRSDSRS